MLFFIMPFLAGYFLARAALAAWWPEELARLVGLLLLLVVAIPLLLAGLGWLERRKATYARHSTDNARPLGCKGGNRHI